MGRAGREKVVRRQTETQATQPTHGRHTHYARACCHSCFHHMHMPVNPAHPHTTHPLNPDHTTTTHTHAPTPGCACSAVP